MDLTARSNDELLTAVRQRIDADATGIIDAAALAEAAHVSESELRSALRAQTGFSPRQFVLHHRLDAVHQALRLHDGDTINTAQAWGFVHLQRFTDAYVSQHGETPAETIASGTLDQTRDLHHPEPRREMRRTTSCPSCGHSVTLLPAGVWGSDRAASVVACVACGYTGSAQESALATGGLEHTEGLPVPEGDH
ncbi:helix-turn-helix domain-containing protein [Curtobacterium sp. VKM Ac-1395]|uniref:helix-turn-helix domain-containing protein n=1 Tax=Curtobacterium sp. VKM Ac-1395 TaxID=2783815 RepID=UPI00188C7FD5|nr:helix-turn-helix domain-containing protein [Curtobacterium sp. VKM Ac-1395]MBF4592118.1 AraC family transcriptional regulator [Curtobacterium sp. VKM Ac-1395]